MLPTFKRFRMAFWWGIEKTLNGQNQEKGDEMGMYDCGFFFRSSESS